MISDVATCIDRCPREEKKATQRSGIPVIYRTVFSLLKFLFLRSRSVRIACTHLFTRAVSRIKATQNTYEKQLFPALILFPNGQPIRCHSYSRFTFMFLSSSFPHADTNSFPNGQFNKPYTVFLDHVFTFTSPSVAHVFLMITGCLSAE